MNEEFNEAIRTGNISEVRNFLSRGADINNKVDSNPPILIALLSDQFNIAKYLVEQPDIDLNVKTISGYTPLHLAAHFGDPELIKLLLKRGLDIDAVNRRGDTPLHEAAFFENREVVEVLLEHGADKNIKNGSGYLPHQSAMNDGNNELSNYIRDYQADDIKGAIDEDYDTDY